MPTDRADRGDHAERGDERDGGGVARVIAVAGVRLAFGLEWHPLARPDEPGADLRRARAAGYRFVARLPDGALVGLARRVDTHRRAHSAVALLVARFAERGAEACLIAGSTAQVAFVGLMDRRPVPGFDRVLPDLDAALAVLQEFRDMHPDQEVRVASHLPGRDRLGDALVPDLLFGQPDGDTRLRPLLPARWPAAVAAGVAVLGLGAGFAMWIRHEREMGRAAIDAARHLAATAASRAQAADLRARRLTRLLEQAGRPGSAPLDRWRDAIAALPLSRAGWTLQQVDCDRSGGCVATWARHHGSLETLDRLPVGALGAPSPRPDPSAGEDALAASMQTALAETAEPPLTAREALIAARLPPLRLAMNVWGSHLQELATVGGAEASLTPAAPLKGGGEADATDLTPTREEGADPATLPVVRMVWRLKDGVWSLPLVQVPPYVVVETLTLNFAASQISYELSGSLFAHGTRY
ncbi:type 4b pilus protein PilO2 [Mitsuaria sp. 7]|uniref:type 4b pilus protein PilO2 n=1 Tax=Mitsuaria sp. 7 TaxID=1658665 RepID=UPI0007DE0527|nr:type 4b pilus protein PilO2 [Mitsuaria sp. 7]ANH67204.1 hypothetical protein ABE85_05795 [Mitsuaria sp. 7]